MYDVRFIYDYLIHKVAIGCVQVARICVCLSPRTHLWIKCKITANKFPNASTTKRDANVSKLTNRQDGTEQQSEEWDGQCMWQVFEWKVIYPGALVRMPERKYIQWFYCEYLKESDHLCIQIFCKMSLKGILWLYVDRGQPAGERVKKWALTNRVMNFGVPWYEGDALSKWGNIGFWISAVIRGVSWSPG